MGTVVSYRKYLCIDGTNLKSYQVIFDLSCSLNCQRRCTDT